MKRLFLIDYHPSRVSKPVGDGDFVINVDPGHWVETMRELARLQEHDRFDVVTGSGIAGAFALKLAETHVIDCVVANPVFDPSIRLLRSVGIGYRTDMGDLIPLSSEAYARVQDVVPSFLERRSDHVHVVSNLSRRWGKNRHIVNYFDSIRIPVTQYTDFTEAFGIKQADLYRY